MSEERRLRAMEVRRLWSIYQEGRSDGIKKATAAERERIVNIINTLAIREPTDEEIVELEFTSGPVENEGEAWAWYRDCDLLDAIQEADDDPCWHVDALDTSRKRVQGRMV